MANSIKGAKLNKYSTSSLVCTPDSSRSPRPLSLILIEGGIDLLPPLVEAPSGLSLALLSSGLDLLLH